MDNIDTERSMQQTVQLLLYVCIVGEERDEEQDSTPILAKGRN